MCAAELSGFVFLMGFEKFCAKCGKTTDDLVNGVCADCYLKKHSLFEIKDFNVERCSKCGKVRVKGKWSQQTHELIANEVASKVKLAQGLTQPKVFVELEPVDEQAYSAKITVTGFINDSLLEQTKQDDFLLSKVSCDSCMKLVSNYREAIIQLRAPTKSEVEAMYEVSVALFAQESARDSLAAIIKVLRGKAGIDLWIGSKKGAARVVRKLEKLYHTNAIISKKLIGIADGGADKYRVTYCIKAGIKSK